MVGFVQVLLGFTLGWIVAPQVRVRYQGYTKVAQRMEGQQIGVQVTGP